MGTGWQTPSPLLSSPLSPTTTPWLYLLPWEEESQIPTGGGLEEETSRETKIRTEEGRQRPREEMRWGWGGKRERNGGSRVRAVAGFSSGLLHTGLCFQPSVDMTFAV